MQGAWEHFKLLLDRCTPLLTPILSDLASVIFYNWLTLTTQNMVDIAAGDYIGDKTPKEFAGLCNLLSINSLTKGNSGQESGYL